MFMIYLHASFHMPSSNSSFISQVHLTKSQTYLRAQLLFSHLHSAEKFHNKAEKFSEKLLAYIILGPMLSGISAAPSMVQHATA
jgi:hypothetical protein